MAEYHSITAVFCIVEIPTKTLDIFLERIMEYKQEWVPSPRIITRGDLSQPSSITTPSTTPTAFFTSPFLDKTTQELNTIFTQNFTSSDAFLPHVFVVLDQRTNKEDIEWLSCQLVRGGVGFDETNEKHFVRSDFYLSMKLASMLENGELDLDESPHGQEKVMGVHNMVNF